MSGWPPTQIVRRRWVFRYRWLLAGALGCLAPAMAHADPCEAPLPVPGTPFAGVVRYVGDGDSLCIGPARDPERWIEIRLADFRAPELREHGGPPAKRLLEQVASGRRLQCIAGRRSYDRIVALCRIEGVAVGDLLRARGGREGGR